MVKIELTRTNILSLILDYSETLGPDTYKEAFALITSKNFNSALVQQLSNSCVVLKNKIGKGQQTHIHITGGNRLFFYSKSELVNRENTIDREITCDVSISNINKLNGSVGHFSTLNIVESSTLTKVAFRGDGSSQVQVSKTSKDGSDFMKLRNNLHVDDLLIFLKYADSEIDKPHLLAFGIPSSFYSNRYIVSTSYFEQLEGQGNISVKTVLEDISESIGTGVMVDDYEDIEDSIYQQLVNQADSEDEDDPASFEPQQYEGNTSGGAATSNRPPTNPQLGKSAIKKSNYKCAFETSNTTHDTFSKPDGTPYMEVHHIIPMAKQKRFENRLDTKANLVPVCPLCHRKLHHGKKEDIDILLEDLLAKHYDALIQSGLGETKSAEPLTEELLKSFY